MRNGFILNDTNLKSAHRSLLDLIPIGEENAISMKSLAGHLEIDNRTLRSLVQQARIAGNIIAGNNSGYFIPKNEDELIRYYNRSMARIKTNNRALNAVRSRLKQEHDHAI